ncbi:MAG: cation-translocating P-type ATPase [Christensenellaceae bacterium]|jgi:Ca2+-transporting ATPase
MKYYLESEERVLQELDATRDGLSENIAQQRLAENGKNKLEEPKKDSIVKRFIMQMADPMILILLVAAVISAVTAIYAGESFIDVFIILFVVIVNAVLGVIQETNAEKAIEALKEMTSATSRVLRAGVVKTIKSEDLVVGDIILLEAGDAVPADARVLESHSMKIEEAALTGESVPTDKSEKALHLADAKDVPLGDRSNMVYMGSTVVYGRGRAVVVATGMQTEMGKIADAISQAQQEQTPLQIKLNQLSKILTYLVVGICVFIFLFDIIRTQDLSGEGILNTFLIAVSLAVAAIPEGLAAVVTIVLSIGVTKMSKRNAVIRRLTAVETLGSTQVICSDKTGTLTQNKMTVVEYDAPDEAFLARAMALSSDAELNSDDQAVGEPTENALVNYAYKLSMPKYILEEEYPRVGEAPFDSMRKRMSTVHAHEGKFIQFTKGAPDEVLKISTHILTEDGIIPLTEAHKEAIENRIAEMASNALRVLAAAYKDLTEEPTDYEIDTLEKELAFIGLVGMIDPIRPEVKAAVEECKMAGIRTVMITGDHKDTAMAIAKDLGIIENEAGVITGMELEEMSDEDLEKNIRDYSVYARVQPEHKVRIIKAWKKDGTITAMTGDGVNDAASIKIADIGIGMGITGTDVTKNVADMVLADDNFATIVAAVGEGRKIYDNIKKCIQFLLASNLSEVLSIFIATLIGFTILEPVHILWINLITDSFPALALGMEEAESDLMQRKPRPARDGIFAGGVGFDIAYQGVIVTILTLAAYLIGHYMEAGVWEFVNSPDGMTMAFITMSMAEIFHSFNMRSQRGSLFTMKKHNKYLYGAAILSFVLTLAVIYVPPIANIFGFEVISFVEYMVAMGLALLIIPIVEVVKLIQRKTAKI